MIHCVSLVPGGLGGKGGAVGSGIRAREASNNDDRPRVGQGTHTADFYFWGGGGLAHEMGRRGGDVCGATQWAGDGARRRMERGDGRSGEEGRAREEGGGRRQEGRGQGRTGTTIATTAGRRNGRRAAILAGAAWNNWKHWHPTHRQHQSMDRQPRCGSSSTEETDECSRAERSGWAATRAGGGVCRYPEASFGGRRAGGCGASWRQTGWTCRLGPESAAEGRGRS